MTTYAYLRVSTDRQGLGDGNGTGLSMQAQERAIREWHRGHDDLVIVREVGSGGKMRPALQQLLDGMAAGDSLVCAKLDRLARSSAGFAKILEQSHAEHWSLVLLDLNLDTSTPTGTALANIMAAMAQLERDYCSSRTREALAAKVAREGPDALKRPEIATQPDVVAHIRKLRHGGKSLRAIAQVLNDENVPTMQGGIGGIWKHGSVSWILKHSS
jgi:DNA invertase Pin-like site-specific DNA recombinase